VSPGLRGSTRRGSQRQTSQTSGKEIIQGKTGAIFVGGNQAHLVQRAPREGIGKKDQEMFVGEKQKKRKKERDKIKLIFPKRNQQET